ncbi:hypothetical protein B0T25DRAFT_542600 [Lasiosphaeria hispida]|uniref:Secreted protein n=1 Tax=Lasiosphaeria hispida TaxID=260671 RepID=A0AAJ0HHF5_9PEZI|nr:hypothetical protein B0T25DRAFT_542600 [Lasiosphaeria hispida]
MAFLHLSCSMAVLMVATNSAFFPASSSSTGTTMSSRASALWNEPRPKQTIVLTFQFLNPGSRSSTRASFGMRRLSACSSRAKKCSSRAVSMSKRSRTSTIASMVPC